MSIWVLIFWTATIQPFEGGQYQTLLQCQRGAAEQLEHWQNKYKSRVRWRCKYTEDH